MFKEKPVFQGKRKYEAIGSLLRPFIVLVSTFSVRGNTLYMMLFSLRSPPFTSGFCPWIPNNTLC
jgi:hypothetical protein